MTDFSLVIPVYKNSEGIHDLVTRIHEMEIEFSKHKVSLEFVIVVDGSPDDSYQKLVGATWDRKISKSIYLLDKNVGSALAIRFGLRHTTGEYSAIMSADLQEPLSLYLDIYAELSKNLYGLVLAARKSRKDGALNDAISKTYWALWSKALKVDMPRGGVDVFGINSRLTSVINSVNDANSALIAMLFDIGANYKTVSYIRQSRVHGKSAWTFRKKLLLLSDSVYGYTDIPLRLLNALGIVGILFSVTLGISTLLGRLFWGVSTPGYTTIVLAISFSTSSLLIALGILGNYVWRIYLNSSTKPLFYESQDSRRLPK